MAANSRVEVTPDQTAPPVRKQQLPSGRSVIVRIGNSGETLEVRAPSGDVELEIVLRADGPVVRLVGARLELQSAEAVAVRCQRFEVHAKEDVCLTGGEMRVRTTGDIHMDGDYIRLNCEAAAEER